MSVESESSTEQVGDESTQTEIPETEISDEPQFWNKCK